MEYNIVTSYKINMEIAKYKHYIKSLGFASSEESKTQGRILSNKDNFAHFYNTKYRTTLYAQGLIGNINFYTDHHILDSILAIYYDKEEFILDFDYNILKEKGIERYLGSFLKKVEIELSERKGTNKILEDKVGDAMQVIKNPGAVSHEDIAAYLEAKRKGLI